MKLIVNKLKIIRFYPNLEFEGDILADKLSDAAYEDVKAENIQKIIKSLPLCTTKILEFYSLVTIKSIFIFRIWHSLWILF